MEANRFNLSQLSFILSFLFSTLNSFQGVLKISSCSSTWFDPCRGAQTVKNPPAIWETLHLISGLGRSPRGGHGNLFQYFCLEDPHGQRGLAGSSPKESDTADRLSTVHSTAPHGGGRQMPIVWFCHCLVQLFVTLWTTARQASLSFTLS